MRMPLANRRVLLIAPRFFGYDDDIALELRRRGADVDILPDRPFDSPFLKAVTRLDRRLVMPATDRFYFSELERLRSRDYCAILVVNGQTLSRTVLAELRSSFPTARLILYLWDSYGNRKSVFEMLDCFDDRFSFERVPSHFGAIKFRPMFFERSFELRTTEAADYDLSFVGTAHTDRYAIVSKLTESLGPLIKSYWYLYLQAPWVYYAYHFGKRSFWSSMRKEFKFLPLSRPEMNSIILRSKAILEIEHPKQSGLTIRAFDAIGASRKLVTTNGLVRDYDFYFSNNICVIDRNEPRIPKSFLETPYQTLPPDIYRKYSVSGWMDEVTKGLGDESEGFK